MIQDLEHLIEAKLQLVNLRLDCKSISAEEAFKIIKSASDDYIAICENKIVNNWILPALNGTTTYDYHFDTKQVKENENIKQLVSLGLSKVERLLSKRQLKKLHKSFIY